MPCARDTILGTLVSNRTPRSGPLRHPPPPLRHRPRLRHHSGGREKEYEAVVGDFAIADSTGEPDLRRRRLSFSQPTMTPSTSPLRSATHCAQAEQQVDDDDTEMVSSMMDSLSTSNAPSDAAPGSSSSSSSSSAYESSSSNSRPRRYTTAAAHTTPAHHDHRRRRSHLAPYSASSSSSSSSSYSDPLATISSRRPPPVYKTRTPLRAATKKCPPTPKRPSPATHALQALRILHDFVEHGDEDASPTSSSSGSTSASSSSTLSVQPFSLTSSTATSSSLSSPPSAGGPPGGVGDFGSHLFRWREVIGRGSFSNVSLAVSTKDNKRYAMKKSINQLHSFKERNQLIREMRLIDSFGCHPHLLRHYRCWQESGHSFIQTEYCANGDLETYLQKQADAGRRLTEADICRFVAQIASGLQRIHAAGAIHMDIKSGNIFVDEHGNLKVGDFGISRSTAKPVFEFLEGDSKYLAAEVLDSQVSPKLDIFSFGMTIYEIISCEALPGSGDRWKWLRTHDLEYSAENSIFAPSAPLRALLQAMVDREPALRPSADEVLAHPLVAPHAAHLDLARHAWSEEKARAMLARQHQQGVHTYAVNIVPSFDSPPAAAGKARMVPASLQHYAGGNVVPLSPVSAHAHDVPAFSTGCSFPPASAPAAAVGFEPAPSSPMRSYAYSYPQTSAAMDTDSDPSSSSKKVRTISADHAPAASPPPSAKSAPFSRYSATDSATHSSTTASFGMSMFSPRSRSRGLRHPPNSARSRSSHKRTFDASRSTTRRFGSFGDSSHLDAASTPLSSAPVFQTLTSATSSSKLPTGSQLHDFSTMSGSSARGYHSRTASTSCPVPPVPTYPWPERSTSSAQPGTSATSLASLASHKPIFGSPKRPLFGASSDPSFDTNDKRDAKSDSPPMFQSPTKRARKSLASDAASSLLLRTPVASAAPSSPFATPSDASSVADLSPLAHPLSPFGSPQPPHASGLLSASAMRRGQRTFSTERPPRRARVLPQRQRSSPSVHSPTAPSSPKSPHATSPNLFASRSMPSSPVASHRKRAPFAVPSTPSRRVRNPFASRSTRATQAPQSSQGGFFSRAKLFSSLGGGGGTSTEEDVEGTSTSQSNNSSSSSSSSNSFLSNPFSALSSAFSLSRTTDGSHSTSSRRGSRPASPSTHHESSSSFKQARTDGRASPFARRLFDEDGDEEMASATSTTTSSDFAGGVFVAAPTPVRPPSSSAVASLFMPMNDSRSKAAPGVVATTFRAAPPPAATSMLIVDTNSAPAPTNDADAHTDADANNSRRACGTPPRHGGGSVFGAAAAATSIAVPQSLPPAKFTRARNTRAKPNCCRKLSF